MSSSRKREVAGFQAGEATPRRLTKKDQILSHYAAGISTVEELVVITGARSS
jgi:hypothetical protein